MLRQCIPSNQLILNFPRTCDNKWFSLSSIYMYKKKALGLRPPAQPFNMYFKIAYPRLKEKHPDSKAMTITKLAAEEWNQLSEAEKEEYIKMCKDKMKEYEADDARQEIERMRKEIEELVHDKPVQYASSWNFYFGDAARNRKVSKEGSSTVMKAATKEFNAMNEKEKSVIQKKFEEKQQDFDEWKQKLKADGRFKIMKDIESNLNQRLKSLEHDKPKRYIPPNFCYYQQNYKSFEGSTPQIKLQESLKKWKTLSAAEREPYYESVYKYRKEIIVWKETTSQDGRMEVIKAIKTLLTKLKM